MTITASFCPVERKMDRIPRKLKTSISELHNQLREAESQSKKEDRHLHKVRACTKYLREHMGVTQGDGEIHNLLVRMCRGD